MPSRPHAEVSELFPSVQQEVARPLLRRPKCARPSPGFARRSRNSRSGSWSWRASRRLRLVKAPRGAWLADKFRELGLDPIHTDEVGNVFGTHPGYGHGYVALSAHMDTVFPPARR